MRNRILSITRSTIPYVKEIMPLAGSVTGCILMQQLDYWFERYPEGFYKFQDAAPGHPMYREGESWTEELGFTLSEFRGAFDRIGVRHKSKSDWSAAEDKFEGKFYCCFTDRRAGLTYYYRNHQKVDAALDALMHGQTKPCPPQPGPAGTLNHPRFSQKPPVFSEKPPVNTADQKSALPGNQETSFPANQDSEFAGDGETALAGSHLSAYPQIAKGESLEVGKGQTVYTETTLCPENTKPLQPQIGRGSTAAPPERGGSGLDLEVLKNLVYPRGLPMETEALVTLMVECPPEHRQAILDETEGARQQNLLRVGIVPFARGLLKAVREGRFTPSAGVAVAAARAAVAVQQEVVAATQRNDQVRGPEEMSDEEIEALPSLVMRQRMLKLKQAALEAGRTQ